MSESDIEITPEELLAKIAEGAKPLLLDVRSAWEHEICCLEGSTLIPLERVMLSAGEIPRDREVVVYCHHGTRSLFAAQILRQHGIEARSLIGGIDLWSIEVDRTIPRY